MYFLIFIVSFLTVSNETFISYKRQYNFEKDNFIIFKVGEIMKGEKNQGLWDNSPLIAWIHNLSKNQFKYIKSKINEFDLGHEVRYIMMIYDNPCISQDDLANMSGQSKGNIAKSLKKLEEDGYIEREVNPENRRKYMLKTTSKGDEFVPKFRQISKDWEKEVGITEDDQELIERIKEIALNNMKLVEDL